MEYFICAVPVMPLRSAASERSEMVSQLVFGEEVVLLETGEKDWVKIRNKFDGYEGWCSTKQLLPISEDFYSQECRQYNFKRETVVFDGQPMQLSIGSFLKGFGDQQTAHWGKHRLLYKGEKREVFSQKESSPEEIEEIALKYINVAYLWGGRSDFGIDCSGFVQSVFRLLGRKLPRDTGQQVHLGEEVAPHKEVKAGDLAFFANEEGKVTHVGLLLDSRRIIHASGKVRIDFLDERGILNQETNSYSHSLFALRRLV